MSKKIGFVCILLGMLFLLASAGFLLYNKMEAKSGARFSQTLLQDVQKEMEEAAEIEEEPQEPTLEIPPETEPREMETVPVGDDASIGILSVPVLELELPVLTEWSYAKLKKAPCHYFGSYYGSDFVIAAHNYSSHFGRLSQLQSGDLVLFTDVAGQVHYYEVVLLETLSPTATEEMIVSGFDLSLFTCTPGGSNRVTVRCNRVIK